MVSSDIFAAPTATGPPPAQIKQRKGHPVPRIGITSKGPLQTNKFYANFFLGSQTSPAYLYPYSIAWAKGRGETGSWGMAISHVEAAQRVYGETGPNGAARYYANPTGIQAICLGASELSSSTALTTDKMSAFAVLISLRPKPGAAPCIQMPLLQCMGMLTAKYSGCHPVIQTGVYFRKVARQTKAPKPGIVKYKMELEDGHTWVLYAQHTKGDPLDLQVANSGLSKAKGPFTGIIQVAKVPAGSEDMFDKACGSYPVDMAISGTTQGARGTYSFTYQKEGLANSKLVMFALPHHVSSFDDATKQAMTSVKLQTTTKGIATAVVADKWTMIEESLPISMAFLPWSPKKGTIAKLPPTAKALIHKIAQREASQDVASASNLNSMYFSGKALAQYATICYCLAELLDDKALAMKCVGKLKEAFARFTENRQQFPLLYESAWGGVVSSATYSTGNAGADFGNTCYNDHHFHWGYFLYAGAVLAKMDQSWGQKNKDYINLMARDYANPSIKDPYFPQSRSFDWIHGHSWAHGLFESADGKDQESSSEDAMAAYAIKMWGMVSGDKNMAARGDMMLAVMSRALNDYYLYKKDNKVQPSNFIGNKAAGIMFENKVDHVTFFGTNTEYVQGIHMLPLQAFTPMMRDDEFVREEWDTYFSNGRADKVDGGWRGILYGNLASADPKTSYRFFSSSNFDESLLDGGASRTWYLCYAAAMGGAS